jgi:hypothetical protein
MSKGLMKRPTPNFVVEVRRQRRSTNEGSKSWLEEPRFARAAASAGAFPSAAALFEPEPKPTAVVEAPPPPPRRILPSLVETVAPPPEEPAPTPRRTRERAASLPAPKVRFRADRTAAQPAPPIELALAETAHVSHRPKPVQRKAAAPKAPPPLPVALVEPPAAARPAARIAPAGEEGALPADPRPESRQTRHRRILERYVHGGEFKPGEGWKRRQKMRRE